MSKFNELYKQTMNEYVNKLDDSKLRAEIGERTNYFKNGMSESDRRRETIKQIEKIVGKDKVKRISWNSKEPEVINIDINQSQYEKLRKNLKAPSTVTFIEPKDWE